MFNLVLRWHMHGHFFQQVNIFILNIALCSRRLWVQNLRWGWGGWVVLLEVTFTCTRMLENMATFSTCLIPQQKKNMTGEPGLEIQTVNNWKQVHVHSFKKKKIVCIYLVWNPQTNPTIYCSKGAWRWKAAPLFCGILHAQLSCRVSTLVTQTSDSVYWPQVLLINIHDAGACALTLSECLSFQDFCVNTFKVELSPASPCTPIW